MPSQDHASNDPLQRRIVELEIALSHQQHLLSQLNEVISDQTRQLMRLETTVKELQSQQKELRSLHKERQGDLPAEKPPHY